LIVQPHQSLRALFESSRANAVALVSGSVLLIVGIALALRGILVYENWPHGTDVGIYLDAANAVAKGQTPYFPAPGTDPWPYKFAYPPPFAEFTYALMPILGTGYGWVAWAFTGLVLLIACVLMLSRSYDPKIPLGFVVLLCGVFATSHIARIETLHGQLNFIMAFFIVAGALLWQRGYSAAAAVPWALAIISKPFLGIIVLFLLRKRDFKAVFATLTLSAILFLGSFLAFSDPLQVFQDWRSASRWYTGIPTVAYPDNQSFYGFFVRLFVPTKYSTPLADIPSAPALLTLPIVVLSFCIFLSAVDSRSHRGQAEWPRTMLEIAVTLGLFMACGPFTENDHLFVLLPGLFGTFLLYMSTGERRWAIACLLWFVAFINLFLPIGVYQFRPPFWPKLEGLMILRSLHYGLAFFIAAAYSGWLLRSERLAKRSSPSDRLSPAVATDRQMSSF
jgi:hypothetical protein